MLTNKCIYTTLHLHICKSVIAVKRQMSNFSAISWREQVDKMMMIMSTLL